MSLPLETKSMLFVMTAVEPCGNFLILLQKLQKYNSLTALRLRVSVRKNVGEDLAFSTDFFRDREAPISSTGFRGMFPHLISGIVSPAFRSCARDHCRPAASDRSCRPSTSQSNGV